MNPVKLDSRNTLIPLETSDKGARGLIVRTATKSMHSNIKIPDNKQFYASNQAIQPFIKTDLLVGFAATCSIHSICVQRKARVIAGLGIKPVVTEPEGKYRNLVRSYERGADVDMEEYDTARKKLTQIDKERTKVQNWVKSAGGDLALREVLERAWYDWENLGWAGLEVVENAKGEPAQLVHVPAHLLRVTRDGRFVYLRSATQKVWFKKFDEERELNAMTGEWSTKKLPEEQKANRLIFFNQYSPLDAFYGLPTWYAALVEILGSQETRDFMLYFFTKRAIPSYAVVLEGGAWTAETIQLIKDFFKRDLRRNYSSTLALEVPTGGKITFDKIAEEPRGALLAQKYLDSLRDAIVSAHGLFPSIVGVIETAHLGGGRENEQMAIFKSVEVRPKQEILENILNRLIREGLDVETVILKLDEIDLWDERSEWDAISKLHVSAQRPVITTNEARKRLRMEPYEDEWADELLFLGPMGGMVPLRVVREQADQQSQAGQSSLPPEFFQNLMGGEEGNNNGTNAGNEAGNQGGSTGDTGAGPDGGEAGSPGGEKGSGQPAGKS